MGLALLYFSRAVSMSLPVCSWNWRRRMYSMPGSSSPLFTDWTRICSRVMVKSFGSVHPSRMTAMTILLPGLPRIFLTASASCMSLVEMPSIFTMRSPGWMPAR